MDNLILAHKKAKRGKSNYTQVKLINKNPEYYLTQLQHQLINQTYQTSPYKHFTIQDKGKQRIISKLPYYPDRICQWAIMLQLEQMFINHYIYDTYASIPKKGIHLAQRRVNNALKDKENSLYCLHFDIHQYFPSIDHKILYDLLCLKIKDKQVLWILYEIINSVDKGLPIGNYLSQYLANYYLSFFDHYIKEQLKIKYYYRYMDDMIILHGDKDYLHTIKHEIFNCLSNDLKLSIKSNWQIYPSHTRGIDFVGYKMFGTHILLRKRIIKNIKRKVKNMKPESKASYHGWLYHCNSYNFRQKHLKECE